jgi:acyl-CoA thioesterase
VKFSLDADTALHPEAAGAWSGEIAEGWETPRGPLGGYVMAIVIRALEMAVGDRERQARSVTMHFLRVPEPGPVTVTAALERAGRSLSSASARMEQEGKLVGLALGAFSRPWESPLIEDSLMPEVPAADDPGAPVDSLRGTSQNPSFVERLVMQRRFGDPPFSGSDRGEAGGWVGIREDRPIDALTIAVLADAWFPAPWPRLTELAPAPTVDLTIHFRSPLPLSERLLLGRFRSSVVRDGFFEEDGELWAADGTLVAQSRQLGILLGAKLPGA